MPILYDFKLACQNNNIKIVKSYLNHIIIDDIDKLNDGLKIAIKHNSYDIVELLVKNNKANIIYDNYKYIRKTLESYNFKMFKILVKSKMCDIKFGHDILLKYAFHFNRIKAYKYILLHYNDINDIRDIDRYINNIDVLTYIMNHKSFIINTQNSNLSRNIIKNSMIFNNLNLLKMYLNDKSLNLSDHEYLLKNACNQSFPEAVKLILDDGRIDPSFNNNICLVNLTYNRDYDILKILLQDKRVDPSFDNNKLLKRLLDFNNKGFIKILLKDSRVFKKIDNNFRTTLENLKFIPTYKPKTLNYTKTI